MVAGFGEEALYLRWPVSRRQRYGSRRGKNRASSVGPVFFFAVQCYMYMSCSCSHRPRIVAGGVPIRYYSSVPPVDQSAPMVRDAHAIAGPRNEQVVAEYRLPRIGGASPLSTSPVWEGRDGRYGHIHCVLCIGGWLNRWRGTWSGGSGGSGGSGRRRLSGWRLSWQRGLGHRHRLRLRLRSRLRSRRRFLVRRMLCLRVRTELTTTRHVQERPEDQAREDGCCCMLVRDESRGGGGCPRPKRHACFPRESIYYVYVVLR